MQPDWIVVGAGFSGATFAERIASVLNQRVLVVDRRPHVGGNAFDSWADSVGRFHPYGPHIFHTNSEKVWRYLSGFTEWTPYFHHVVGYVDGVRVPIPFNFNSIYALFPPLLARKLERRLLSVYEYGARVPVLELRSSTDEVIRFLGDYVYKKVFLGYTVKQWGVGPDELDASVTARVPIVLSRDNRYFADRWQALPAAGYATMFENILSHPNIELRLSTEWEAVRGQYGAARVVFTGAIDEYYEYRFGRLPYRSMCFKSLDVTRDLREVVGTVNFPNEFDYTRFTDMSVLTGSVGAKVRRIYEIPGAHVPGVTEPHYPIPMPSTREIFREYRAFADQDGVSPVFLGRLADYSYYNMDQACARALALFERIAAGGVAAHLG